MDYAEFLESKAFPTEVAELHSLMARLSDAWRDGLEAEDNGLVGRVGALLDHILTVTGSARAELLPMGAVNGLAEALHALRARLQMYAETADFPSAAAQVRYVKDATDAVALALARWPHTGGEDWRDAVTAAASTYRRSMGTQLRSLQTDVERTQDDLANLWAEARTADDQHRAAMAEQVAELNEAVARVRMAVDAVEKQRTVIESQLTSSIDRADQAIATQQQQFAEAQEKRSIEFRSLTDDLVEQSTVDVRVRVEQADLTLQEMRDQLDEAQELVSVFAAAGTANAFSKEASTQAKIANNWRRGAIFLGIVAGLTAISLLSGGASQGEWQVVVGKLAISLAFGGVAAYAAAQSSSHRRREETARHLELNIVAFGPFVRELSADKQVAAREKVLESIFLRDIAPVTTRLKSDGADRTPSDEQLTLIARILDLVRR